MEPEKPALNRWDTTFLIMCAKFQVESCLVLDHLLDVVPIVIPSEIKREVVDAGVAGGYPDALEIQARIASGLIQVRTAP